MWQSQTILHVQAPAAPLTWVTTVSAFATLAVALFAVVQALKLWRDWLRHRRAADLIIQSTATVLRTELEFAVSPTLRRDDPDFAERGATVLRELIRLEPRLAGMTQHITEASGKKSQRAGEAYSLFSRAMSYLQRAVNSGGSADEAFVVTTNTNLQKCVAVLYEIGFGPEWDEPNTTGVARRLGNVVAGLTRRFRSSRGR